MSTLSTRSFVSNRCSDTMSTGGGTSEKCLITSILFGLRGRPIYANVSLKSDSFYNANVQSRYTVGIKGCTLTLRGKRRKTMPNKWIRHTKG